jgi:hypothetical protein
MSNEAIYGNEAIYRVSLDVEDAQYVRLTGRPIAVAADRGGDHKKFDMWYEHDDKCHSFEAHIYVLGTGHPVPWSRWTRHAYRHLGTIVYPEPNLVWHIYRGPNKGQVVGL